MTRAPGSSRLWYVSHVVVPKVSRQMILSGKSVFVLSVTPRHRAIDIQWIWIMLSTVVAFKTGPPSEYATAMQADPLLFTAARGSQIHNWRWRLLNSSRDLPRTFPLGHGNSGGQVIFPVLRLQAPARFAILINREVVVTLHLIVLQVPTVPGVAAMVCHIACGPSSGWSAISLVIERHG